MIIERYIHREILHRLIWIALLLLLVLTTNKFVEYLGDAAAGKIPASYVLKLLWFRMLSMQTEVLPVALFLAVILAFSRLNQDNELAVMAAAGIGKRSQLHMTLRFSLVFSVLIALFAFVIGPWAKLNVGKLKAQAWQEVNISGLTPGKFKELSKGNSIVYIEALSPEKLMENVFLQIQDKGKNSVFKSDTAYFHVDEKSGHRFIIFKNGRRYQGQPGMPDYQITQYEKYAALIELKDEANEIASPETASTALLLVSPLPAHQGELQWRISSLLSCVLLALLGVLLNQYPFGQKPFALLLLGILIYFIYNNLLGISRTLLERGNVSPWLGLWWVHALLILSIAIIYHFPELIQRLRRDSELQVLPADP